MRTLAISVLAVALAQNLSAQGTVQRASVNGLGGLGNADSTNACISGNGRYVAFSSDATNLVPYDTNGVRDVFIRDLQLGRTERVAEDADHPSLSATGRYIAWGNNAQTSVYLLDRRTGTMLLFAPGRIPVVNSGGDAVVYEYADNIWYWSGVLPIQLTSGNGRSWGARYSGGRITFCSVASNLVDGDTNGVQDAFVYGGYTLRVSISTSGEQGNQASCTPVVAGDGRLAFFQSLASNLDPSDANGLADIFVRDLQLGTTELLMSTQGNGDMNSDPVVSADARYVTFDSTSTNLVAGANGWRIYVYDRLLGSIATPAAGRAIDSYWSGSPSISSSGQSVAFFSSSGKLVPGDHNNALDVFVWQR